MCNHCNAKLGKSFGTIGDDVVCTMCWFKANGTYASWVDDEGVEHSMVAGP